MGLSYDSELIVEERRRQVDISAHAGCARVTGTVYYKGYNTYMWRGSCHFPEGGYENHANTSFLGKVLLTNRSFLPLPTTNK
jgi:hypothetical protein